MLSLSPEHIETLGYFLGLGAVLLGALGLLAEAGPGGWAWRALPLMVVAAGGLPLLFFPELRALPGGRLAWLLLVAACALCYCLRSSWGGRLVAGVASLLRRPLTPWAAVAGLGLAAFAAAGLAPDEDATARYKRLLGPHLVDDSSLQSVETLHAVTDRGRPVTLYAPQLAAMTADELAAKESDALDTPQFTGHLLRLASADASYNCHGWTFLGGQYWIRGRDIPTILEDNGYYAVDAPLPGDVVVFRNAADEVSHTAVVRGVTSDQQILLESKWGWGGRFIHAAQVQCYGTTWKYYRSQRPDGHRLRFLIDSPEQSLPRVAG